MRIGNFHYFNFRDLPPVQPTMWMYWYWLVSGNEKQAIRVFQIDRQLGRFDYPSTRGTWQGANVKYRPDFRQP